jgi:hypothetical protein
MAEIFVHSILGNDTFNSGTTPEFPVATIAKAITLLDNNNTNIIYLMYSEYTENVNVSLRKLYKYPDSNYFPILNYTHIGGGLLIGGGGGIFLNAQQLEIFGGDYGIRSSSSATNFYISNLKIHNVTNAILGGSSGSVTLFKINQSLIYNCNFGVTNIGTFTYSNYTTFYKVTNIYMVNQNGVNNHRYRIFCDSEVRYTAALDRYSLFYGNCTIWNGLTYIPITSVSDLQTNGGGTFDFCQVMPDVVGVASDFGDGTLKITSASHGLADGEDITIRSSSGVSNNSYVINRTSIELIDENSFRVPSINFVSGESSVNYNVPLFMNEFEDNFDVWDDSIACELNAESAFIPIGAGEKGKYVGADTFTAITDGKVINENGYSKLVRTDSNEATVTDSISVNYNEPILINKIKLNTVIDLVNGCIPSFAYEIGSDTYATGVTLPSTAEGFKVQGGAITYNGIVYTEGSFFQYITGQTTFSDGGSGAVVREVLNWYPRKFEVKLIVTRNSIISNEFTVYAGEEIKVNYANNDPNSTIIAGNADPSFDVNNQFNLDVVTALRYRIKIQNGDLSQNNY